MDWLFLRAFSLQSSRRLFTARQRMSTLEHARLARSAHASAWALLRASLSACAMAACSVTTSARPSWMRLCERDEEKEEEEEEEDQEDEDEEGEKEDKGKDEKEQEQKRKEDEEDKDEDEDKREGREIGKSKNESKRIRI